MTMLSLQPVCSNDCCCNLSLPLTRLSSYFNDSKLLFENQYGFRPKHSTEYAALELVDNNEVPINIFLYLSKAFDTINHTIS